MIEAAEAAEGSVARALTLLGGDAVKLHHKTAAMLATLPRVDPRRELHALGDALGGSDKVALATFVDSIDRWVGARMRTEEIPMPTCRALHGWRRCGKRSAAPRAIPLNTISSESRLCSRYLGCLRKPRDNRGPSKSRSFY